MWYGVIKSTGDGDIYFRTSTDGGATFSSTTINLSNSAGSSVDPKIATVSGNNVYVVWSNFITPGNFDILFKKSTDGGASFSDTPINLSNNTRSSSTPEIAAVASSVSGSSRQQQHQYLCGMG